MNKILLLAAMLILMKAKSQSSLNVVPMPVEVKIEKKGNSMMVNKGPLPLNTINRIEYTSEKTKKIAEYLSDTIFKLTGLKMKLCGFLECVGNMHQPPPISTNCIFLKTDFEIDSTILAASSQYPEYYELSVQNYLLPAIPARFKKAEHIKQITITAGKEEGIFRGIQTLLQIIKQSLDEKDHLNKSKTNQKLLLPLLSIKDYPRFSYRGMHLDVCRHFIPVDLVKKYIDYLAMYKLNTFHWHLTDDQGWRIEIKKYPKLTEVGGWRNGTIIGGYPGTGNDSLRYGGFYTQEQIKEVVHYAAERYITVIPEIEMPGHSSAAIAAYPELSCFPGEDTKYPAECVWAGPTKGKQVQQTWGVFEDVFCPSEYTFKFLEDVLDEVIELFPSQYIHIGGDECPKDAWKRSAFCQQLMKEKGLKDEHELQGYFMHRVEKYINSRGKKVIGWDEILEGGLASNATVMSWRGEAGGIAAAKQHQDVIMTPEYPLYFNHSQTKNEDSVTQGGYNPLDAVYNYEPVPKELTVEEGKYVLGAQGNVWSEYIGSKSKLEYSIFPRMAALAEVLWTPKEKRDWKDFERRLPAIFERMDKEKINYSKAYYELKATVQQKDDFEGIVWKIEGNTTDNKIQKITFSRKTVLDSIVELNVYDSLGRLTGINRTNIIDDYFFKPKDNSLIINKDCIVTAKLINGNNEFGFEIVYDKSHPVAEITQQFHFNKATGKKITLSAPADTKYPGDGAFTLVNGVQNTAGLSKSSEYLGFNGKNCEAIIDLGKTVSISKVTVHALNRNADWIWRPSTVEVFGSDDGVHFRSLGLTGDYVQKENATGIMTVDFPAANTRFLKVLISNQGIIPVGNAGSGNPAWLFVDEIEAE